MSEEQPTTKIAVISEIMKTMGITPEEMNEINEDFKNLIDVDNCDTAGLLKACMAYDTASFIIGAIVGTSIMELADGIVKEKIVESQRFTTDNMEII